MSQPIMDHGSYLFLFLPIGPKNTDLVKDVFFCFCFLFLFLFFVFFGGGGGGW